MADGPGTTPSAEEDFRRELTARRKDLEREFQDKQRELKAQHQRRMDALKQEQADWEAHRRQQGKELADKAEKVRRVEENARKAEGLKAQERKELEHLRLRVAELEQEKLDARAAAMKSQAKADRVRQGARSTSRLSSWLAGLSIAGGILWSATAWGSRDGSMPLAAAFLLVSLGLGGAHLWSSRRTRA